MDRVGRDKFLGFMLNGSLIAVTVFTLISLFTEISVKLNFIEFFLGLSMFLQANLNWERQRAVSILCLICAAALWFFAFINYLR